MFRLYEPAFATAVEDWGKLSKKLQVEKENLQTIMHSMSQAWVGETQRESEALLKEMLTTGLFEQTAEIVEMIYRIQYNLHPEIIAQMERCEKMGEQLLENGYVAPYLTGNGYHNDGYLCLDDEYVAAFNCAVTEVLEQATEARSIIYEAMNACDGMIDFSAEREALEAGFRKVKRIENFAAEFNKYVIEVKRIEEEIVSGFRSIIANDPDPTNQKWNQILQNLIVNKNDGYQVQQMSKTRMVAGFSTMPEPAEELTMEQVEAILQKPVTEWTQLDAEQVAHAYAQAIENRDVNMLNMITNGLLVESYTDPVLMVRNGFVYNEASKAVGDGLYYKGTYTAGLDADKCNMILAQLDPLKQGESYFTLTRLRNMTFEKEILTQDPKYKIYDSYLIFSQNELGQLQAEMSLDYEIYDQDRQIEQLKFYTTDLYAEAGEAAIENMETLLFTTDEIVTMLSNVRTDQDKEYVFKLMEANTQEDYKVLFAINPDKLSDEARTVLTSYAYGLCKNSYILDQNGNISTNEVYHFTQLETFLNGLLSKDFVAEADYNDDLLALGNGAKSNYTQDYLMIMASGMNNILEINGNLIALHYQDVPDSVINDQYSMYNLYTLLLSLNEMEENRKEFSFKNLFKKGYTISNIELNNQNIREAKYSYVLTQNYSLLKPEENIITMVNVEPKELNDKAEWVEAMKLDANLDKEVNKKKVYAIADIIATFNPEVKLLLAGVKMIDNQEDASKKFDFAKKANDYYYKDGEYKDGISNSISVVDTVNKAYEEIEKLYKERDTAYAKILDDWFENSTKVEMGSKTKIEESVLVAQGKYDPNEIIKKEYLYNEGFSFMCESEQDVKDGIKAINDYDYSAYRMQSDERSEEAVKNILEVLWRGPRNEEEAELMNSLDAAQFEEYVDELSDIVKDKVEFYDVPSVKEKTKLLEELYKGYCGGIE